MSGTGTCNSAAGDRHIRGIGKHLCCSNSRKRKPHNPKHLGHKTRSILTESRGKHKVAVVRNTEHIARRDRAKEPLSEGCRHREMTNGTTAAVGLCRKRPTSAVTTRPSVLGADPGGFLPAAQGAFLLTTQGHQFLFRQSPMLLVAAWRSAFFFPDEVGPPGNLFMRQNFFCASSGYDRILLHRSRIRTMAVNTYRMIAKSNALPIAQTTAANDLLPTL